MNLQESEIVIIENRVYHLGLEKGQLAKNVFLVGDPARAIRVSNRFERIDHEIANREYLTFTGVYKGLPVSVIGTGIGTDNVEIALVEAFIVNEIDFDTRNRNVDSNPLTIIRIGTSGGVQSDVDAGVFGIASYALGLDSTGIYYDFAAVDDSIKETEKVAADILEKATPQESRFKGKINPYASRASTNVTDALANQAKKENAEFEVGITVSSPGFYGPSSRLIEGLTNTIPDIKHQLAKLNVNGQRVVNMEMESSLLFHLCGQMGYKSGTICPIISNPDKSDSLVDYDGLIEKAITIGLEAMIELKLAQ